MRVGGERAGSAGAWGPRPSFVVEPAAAATSQRAGRSPDSRYRRLAPESLGGARCVAPAGVRFLTLPLDRQLRVPEGAVEEGPRKYPEAAFACRTHPGHSLECVRRGGWRAAPVGRAEGRPAPSAGLRPWPRPDALESPGGSFQQLNR